MFTYTYLVSLDFFFLEPRFELITESKTWEDALNHCRDNNMDLASIVDEETQALAELEAMKANTPLVWLGLRYDCTLGSWFWVDGQRVEFSRWANCQPLQCDVSGAMERHDEHDWWGKSDDEKFNFICAR